MEIPALTPSQLSCCHFIDIIYCIYLWLYNGSIDSKYESIKDDIIDYQIKSWIIKRKFLMQWRVKSFFYWLKLLNNRFLKIVQWDKPLFLNVSKLLLVFYLHRARFQWTKGPKLSREYFDICRIWSNMSTTITSTSP